MFRLERRTALAAALCLLLAIVHTWPLATAPGTLSRNDNADAELNEWILAWVAHQLPRAPAHLFDGNIFYPERDTLAFSEPLIVPALMGAPLQWLGASPVFVFNIVLLLGFALTAWAGYALAFEWTGDRAAGMLAGSMFAFNTHTLTRLAHVQGIHAWGLPLALLVGRSHPRPRALARCRVARRLDDGDGLHVRLPHRLRRGHGRGRPRRARRRTGGRARAASSCSSAAATVLAAIAVLPVYLPYRRVREARPGPLDRIGRRILRHADGISRSRRNDPFLHVERAFWTEPGRRLLPRLRRHRPGDRSAIYCAMVARAGENADCHRNFSTA